MTFRMSGIFVGFFADPMNYTQPLKEKSEIYKSSIKFESIFFWVFRFNNELLLEILSNALFVESWGWLDSTVFYTLSTTLS